MTAFNLVLLGLFIVTQLSTDFPGCSEKITIETRILRIPAFQSKMSGGGTLEDGRVWGVVMGGNVTRNFPEGITVFEAPSDREDHEYVRLIKDKVSSSPCSCMDFIQIATWKRFHVELDSSAAGQKVCEIHERISGRGEYWLHFAVDTDQEEVFLSFQFEAIYYDSLKFDIGERIVREELFNRTIPLIRGQVLLVSFAPPKSKDGSRGSAYWFVVKERIEYEII